MGGAKMESANIGAGNGWRRDAFDFGRELIDQFRANTAVR